MTATAVIHPIERSGSHRLSRDPSLRLGEACGLAEAIGCEIRHDGVYTLTKFHPNKLLGGGHLERLDQVIADEQIELLVIDGPVTPIQQRNLEKRLKVKVLDRTGLILEIFGERAATREGTLQVELAHLEYQRSRLVRSWTHLERQRGGLGFVGGPGETQIEADRRMIRERIGLLKKRLQDVTRTRRLHRAARKKVPYPIIALVGYTNAGKSTLFNRLTESSVLAQDMLFATLDPTLRRISLSSGDDVMLADTVGFISDLPTQLVAAFRATLEEVLEADIILHVRDIAHPETDIQKAEVLQVLKELGVEDDSRANIIEVANKIDLLSPEERGMLDGADLGVSAVTGEGVEQLESLLERKVQSGRRFYRLSVPGFRQDIVAWFHRQGALVEEKPSDDYLTNNLLVQLDERLLGSFRRSFGDFKENILEP